VNPPNSALLLRRQPAAGSGHLAWRVLSAQLSTGGVAAVVVWVAGGLEAALSLLFGILVVALPQWCAHQVLRVGSLGLPRLFALEILRVGSSAALLLYGARSMPDFVWWGALIGLILAVKAPWFVLLREGTRS